MFVYARINTDSAGVESIEPWGLAAGHPEQRFFYSDRELDPKGIYADPMTKRPSVRPVVFAGKEQSFNSDTHKLDDGTEEIYPHRVVVTYNLVPLTAQELEVVKTRKVAEDKDALVWQALAEYDRLVKLLIEVVGDLSPLVATNPRFKVNLPENVANRIAQASKR